MVRRDSSKCKFRPTMKGLYTSQMLALGQGVATVNTAEKNKEAFTKCKVKQAEEARRLVVIIGRPSERQMVGVVAERQLINCRVTERDVYNVLTIFRPEVGSLNGKTAMDEEMHVERSLQQTTPEIIERHHEVVLYFDVMYVNDIPSAISITCPEVPYGGGACKQEEETRFASVKTIQATNARRKFLARRVSADNEIALLDGKASISL